jgi:hypothetical protein
MKTVLFTLVVAAGLAACGSKKPTPAPPAPIEPGTGSAVGSAAGSAEQPESTGSAAGSAAAETGSAAGSGSAAEIDWTANAAKIDGKTYKDLDKKQRGQLMKQYVLPKAKELFAAFDPKFGEVTCKTCHGDGVKDHTFKMPNPKIKPLPGTEEAFMAWVKQNPDEGKWAGFMAQQLTPAMGQILGMKPFDPKTKTGEFSCGACHTMKK